jgi:hypothetical protein
MKYMFAVVLGVTLVAGNAEAVRPENPGGQGQGREQAALRGNGQNNPDRVTGPERSAQVRVMNHAAQSERLQDFIANNPGQGAGREMAAQMRQRNLDRRALPKEEEVENAPQPELVDVIADAQEEQDKLKDDLLENIIVFVPSPDEELTTFTFEAGKGVSVSGDRSPASSESDSGAPIISDSSIGVVGK